MAETHGVLDGPDGHPDPSSYTLIADRDGLTYKSTSVRHLYGGEIDTQPLNGKNEWIYYPPRSTPTASHPAFGVPYLPDVLARGVALLNLPGKKDAFVRVPFDSVGTWPQRRAVRLVVNAGKGAPVLPAAVQDLDGAIEHESTEGVHHAGADELVLRAEGPRSDGAVAVARGGRQRDARSQGVDPRQAPLHVHALSRARRSSMPSASL